MEARVQKWGNSDGIRIPSSILKSLNIKTNDILNIDQEDDKIIISIPKNFKKVKKWEAKLLPIYSRPNFCLSISFSSRRRLLASFNNSFSSLNARISSRIVLFSLI